MDWTDVLAPGGDDILALAEATRSALPQPFQVPAAEVLIRVLDIAPSETLEALGVEDAFDLTALYDGVPLTLRSFDDPPRQPDTIWLYRAPILDEWAMRGDVTLGVLVAHVTVHEFAHHFGWSDADIARIDRWWE